MRHVVAESSVRQDRGHLCRQRKFWSPTTSLVTVSIGGYLGETFTTREVVVIATQVRMRDDTVETASDSAHDAALSGTFGKLNLQVRAWIGELWRSR